MGLRCSTKCLREEELGLNQVQKSAKSGAVKCGFADTEAVNDSERDAGAERSELVRENTGLKEKVKL